MADLGVLLSEGSGAREARVAGWLAELISEIRSAIVAKADNKPAPDRGLYLLSPILFPITELPPRRTDQ